MRGCSSTLLANWYLNLVQKLQHFSKSGGCNFWSVEMWYGYIPSTHKVWQTVSQAWPVYRLKYRTDIPGSSAIHSYNCSSTVRVSGCPILGKLDSLYSVRNLSTILSMVESANVVTFGNSCQNRILMVA